MIEKKGWNVLSILPVQRKADCVGKLTKIQRVPSADENKNLITVGEEGNIGDRKSSEEAQRE